MMKSKFKIRIFQPLIQEYRLALYEGLAARYGDAIEVWASDRRGQEKSLPIKGMRYDYDHKWHQFGPFVWQSGFSLEGLIQGDVVVICGDIHQLSSLWIAIKAKWCGIGVVWWGHHVSALARSFNVRVRLAICRFLSDVVLCYTDAGIEFMKERGFKYVFATGNTIDLAEVDREVSKCANFVSENRDGRTILFCGVLRGKTHVDVLLRALEICKADVVKCIIIGDGEKSEEWRALAKDLGVDEIIEWVGELRGQASLAPYFCCADVFVYPGRIGLSLIHAFAYGLPVILNDNPNDHGPEYVAFKPGENGWAFKCGSPEDLARQIREALADDDERRQRGKRGYDYVHANYSMSRMVERYTEAIECARRIK